MEEFARFKAREWENWLLFCCYPVLLNILDKKYLNLWLLFSQAVYLLSQTVVSRDHVNVADALIKHFIAGCQEEYGEISMTFNLHILYHFAEHVARWGPIFVSSAYCFEAFNGMLKKVIHSQGGIPHQVMRAISWEQCLHILEPIVSQNARDFVKVKIKKERRRENPVGSSVLLGTSKKFSPTEEERWLCERDERNVDSCEAFDSLLKDTCVFFRILNASQKRQLCCSANRQKHCHHS